MSVKNVLVSELSSFLDEIRCGSITIEIALSYFSQFLLYAKVDSKLVVAVLEEFGEEGKYQAMVIKVNEGW